MASILRPTLALLALLTLLTGGLYPLAVTAIAQACFPSQANGSIVRVDGAVVGSTLIGHPFDGPGYFWGRPSATPGHPYNASASGGSNFGPSNPALREAVAARIKALQDADRTATGPVPVDLVTASASGLDPHITPAAALYQVDRVATARHLPPGQVQALVLQHIEHRLAGVFGEPRVNVLLLNLALDRDSAPSGPTLMRETETRP